MKSIGITAMTLFMWQETITLFMQIATPTNTIIINNDDDAEN